MKNLLGFKGCIRVRTFDIDGNRYGMEYVNKFLDKYEGNIIDIQTQQMVYGVTRIIVIYNEFDEERRNEA